MNSRKVATFAIGPIGGAFLSLITLPVITWFFSQEDVGRLAMLQVIISFSTLLFSLGLDQAYVREFHEVSDKPALLKRSMFPGLLLLSMTLFILLSFGGVLAGWVFEIQNWYLSLLVAAIVLSALISRFLTLILRMNDQALAFSVSQILPKLMFLFIVLSYVLFGAEYSLTNLVIANMVAFVFVCLVFMFKMHKEWRDSLTASLDHKHLIKMLRFGLPLVLGGVAYWGLTAIDKIFLRALVSFEELGVYSVAVSFAGAAVILQSIFATVWAPTVYKWASEGKGLENVFKVNRFILLLVIIFFCLAGLMSWTITPLLPPNYVDVQWLLVACLGAPLLYTLSESTAVGIGISRRSSFALLATLIAFLVNLLGNWIMIPHFGAAGAAASTCIAFWSFFTLRTEFSIYLWQSFPRLLLYVYSGFAVAGACALTLFGTKIHAQMFVFWTVLLIAVCISFRSEIKQAIIFFSNLIKGKEYNV